MHLKTVPIAILTSLALALPATAQCGTMTVTGDGAPGSTLTFDVSGVAGNAFVVILAGRETGDFTVNFGPLGTLELGLLPPFIPFTAVRTDADGNATLDKRVPNGVRSLIELHAQGVSVKFSFSLGAPGTRPTFGFDFCETNVVDFSVGS